MIHVRQAALADLPNMEECARSFFALSKLPGVFKFDHWLSVWTTAFTAGMGVIFIAEEEHKIIGGLGGIMHLDLNTADLLFQEAFWYSLESHRGAGVKLFFTCYDWARKRGCLHMRMGYLLASMPEKVRRFYERAGFEAVEVIYSKEIA